MGLDITTTGLAAAGDVLARDYGGHWAQHPEYSLSDWKWAVTNEDTRLGYWAWVADNLDADEDVAEATGEESVP
jgi:hypothetical protein